MLSASALAWARSLAWRALLPLCLAAPAAAADIDRGRYLVEALTACDNCHTPRGPDGYRLDKRFSGGSQTFNGETYSVRGPNISSDAATGIGSWSDERLAAAIIAGVGPEGRLAPAMPSEYYRILTARDLEAVIAFLRTAAPVEAARPAQRRDGEQKAETFPGAEAPFEESALDDPLRRGFYVATLARCMECHSGETNGALDHKEKLGAGGKLFRTPAGTAVGANITQHPTAGVGAWSDAEIKAAIVAGVGRDGKPLKPTMANLSKAHFSKMTPRDLDALILWLRTIPPRAGP
ncbi:c-type cytochrome [Methylosinus sp. LW4]|uniref:c-type cytochrome n=1 Tax=Methylosinus sp. LW4 TaxID=136993 RepID=UPI0003A89979|nr:c-type cytochrome [Methylosinus sp. LW4]